MRLFLLFIISLFSGLFSLGMLFYYYTLERDFATGYKEVIAGFNQIQNNHERTTYGVLQSTLFAYYNQDVIAQDRRKLGEQLDNLTQHMLLKQPHYADVHTRLMKLKEETAAYIRLVERHLMINGAIKNSNVFLAAYEKRSIDLFDAGSEVRTIIHKIIDDITQAKKMLDKSYLQQGNDSIERLQKGTYNSEQQEFISNLLTHITFIQKQYPEYLDVFYDIINSPLRAQIESVKLTFTEQAKNDMEYINNVASSLFVMILFAIGAIGTLLWMLRRENTVLTRLKERLQYSLNHDRLTRLKNRNSYESLIESLKSPKILLVNIVKFKFFNDFYGTDTGDMILKKVGGMLEEVLKDEEAVCHRIGGDEFAIIFDETETAVIEAVAGRISTMFEEERFEINDISMHISINMAISEHRPLLETADMAIKHLKANPTGNLLHYSPELNVKEQIQSNIEMTQTLRSALFDDRLIPYYQPIMDLESREVIKYEALARLRKEDGTVLTPFAFLPVAYNTPLYYQITRIMITKSMEYFADKPYRFSINLGMQDLEDESIVSMILGQLSSYGSEVASRMDIELLETENLSNKEKVKTFIKEVKTFGCRIAIDDFGSGFSNFSHLSEFDIDIVKIDGSLIKEVTTNEQHYKTVKAIMSLVTELGIESVAEFVQDEKSATLLSDLGVMHAQGFYFGRPQEEISDLL
ncbi:MAG: EAL domain-containing protein [Sulfurimonadaceae bacterium]|nr:EAL domain-containing protein [Sulfurimonadaceae bacterium]